MAFHTDADKIRKEAEANRVSNVNLGVAMKLQQDDSEFRCKSLLEEAVAEGTKYLQKNSFLVQRIK